MVPLRLSFLILLTVFFLFAVADGKAVEGGVESAKYLLRYRFSQDECLRWNVSESLKIETTVKGEKGVIETQSFSAKIWTVKELLQDGKAVFEYQTDDVRMKQFQTKTDDVKEAEYDSRKDKKIPVSFSNLEGTIGIPLAQITIDPLGTTVKKALRQYSANTENRIVIPLPEEPIAVGENWQERLPVEIEQPNGKVKKVNARRVYTLQSVNLDVAKIRFDTQIFTVLTPQEQSQIIAHYASGTMELDLTAGHIIRQQLTVDKRIVGFYGQSDTVHHQVRRSECCCGLKSCELCNSARD